MKLHEFISKTIGEKIPENSKIIFTGNFKNTQEENISWGIDSVHDAATFAKRSSGKIFINAIYDGFMHIRKCMKDDILEALNS